MDLAQCADILLLQKCNIGQTLNSTEIKEGCKSMMF